MNCSVCKCNIANEEDFLKKQYEQEGVSDITYGPWCSSCFKNSRVCTKCNKPFQKETGEHIGRDYWLCSDCK